MGSGIKKHLLSRSLTKIRQWDYIASVRHDVTLANSRNTAQRIKKYYKKDSTVLYPPVETHRFATKITPKKISPYAEYYIILSALTEFKKLDIALKNIRDIPEANLVIIGDGDYRQELQDISQGAKNITFVGAQYGQDLVSLVQGSLGLIFP